ncbi:hypothetical protein D3C86_1916270 [compost metagenome]
MLFPLTSWQKFHRYQLLTNNKNQHLAFAEVISDLIRFGINQILHDIAYGFLQHGFHHSMLQLMQADVEQALLHHDKYDTANMVLIILHHQQQNLSVNPVSLSV